MADLKISQLTGATTPLAGTEVLPIVQSSSTKKVSVADLTAGRTVAMTQLDVGNLRAAVNTISSTNTNGNIIIDPNGSGMTGVNMTPNSNSGQLQVAGQNATTSIAGIPTMSLVDGDANNEYCNLRYATSADGSLGAIGFKAVTTGGYPSSVGALEIAIQNGAGSNTVLTGTAAGEISVSIGNLQFATANKGLYFAGNGDVIWRCGAGTPEGAVTAPVGSLFTRTDGGAGTTLYVKESGAGNTGWVAK